MNVPHGALFQNCKNGSTPPSRRAARGPDKKSFKRHLLLNHWPQGSHSLTKYLKMKGCLEALENQILLGKYLNIAHRPWKVLEYSHYPFFKTFWSSLERKKKSELKNWQVLEGAFSTRALNLPNFEGLNTHGVNDSYLVSLYYLPCIRL